MENNDYIMVVWGSSGVYKITSESQDVSQELAHAIENDLPLSEKELILNMGDVVIWVVRTLVGSEYVYSEIRWEEYR